MLGNRPGNTIEVTLKEDVIFHTAAGIFSAAAGDTIRMSKADYAQCSERTVLESTDVCPDVKWLITIPAGEAWTAEPPLNGDSTPYNVSVEHSGELLYFSAVDGQPIVVPTGEEITADAPSLLRAGRQLLGLVDGDSVATTVGFVNCSTEDQKVEVTWSGCK